MATDTTTTPEVRPPSRRLLFGDAAAVLAAIPLGSAATLTPTSNSDQTPAGADAELIALCQQFDAIERRYIRLHEIIKDDDERKAHLGSLDREQEALIDRICAVRATTAEGWRARAATIHLFVPHIMKDISNPGAGIDQRMQAALVRDLIGGGESPTPCVTTACPDASMVSEAADTALTPIAALQRRMTSLAEERTWMDQRLVEMDKGPDRDILDEAFNQNLDELLDIADQIAVLPARNLHDAAIQAVIAYEWVLNMGACEPLELPPKMQPLLASIILAVSRAGAIDTDKLGWGNWGDLLRCCHPEIVA